MKNILLLGAGRSATTLIRYLKELVQQQGWHLVIADVRVDHLAALSEVPEIRSVVLDLDQTEKVRGEVGMADLVISMLPAIYHPTVGGLCLAEGKHLLTASYVTPAIREMDRAVREAGLVFMMEAGLDPGLDHLSAIRLIRQVRAEGGHITAFKSYTGGLVAPESDNNPWHYKISWNPRNIVLAGQGTARYLEAGQVNYIPYQQLFRRAEALTVPGQGDFEGYANRDSLTYREPYGLEEVPTLLRGTLRRRGFCRAWHQLVWLGLTDDSFRLENSRDLTYRAFLEAFLPPASDPAETWVTRLARYLKLAPAGEEMQCLAWLEFPEEAIGLEQATPAQALEKLLTCKWVLAPDDKDLVVMQHVLEYEKEGIRYRITSSLVVKGEDAQQTAMAKTVGLPAGILAKMILLGQVSQKGVVIPTAPALYEPVLAELESLGIVFVEEIKILT